MKLKKLMPIRRARYFLAGIREHRRMRPFSGATEYQLLVAYWNGYHFAHRMPMWARRFFKEDQS